MKRVQVEYHETTGEITCVRFFDCAVIPPQPIQPGHAEQRIDCEREPELAEAVKHAPHEFRVHPGKKQIERKVK